MYQTELLTTNGPATVIVENGLLRCGGQSIVIGKINSADVSSASGKFPLWPIVAIIVGFFMFNFSAMLGFIALVAGVLRWVFYFLLNPTYRLDLHTSSNETFSIAVNKKDRDKLIELHNVLLEWMN